MPEEILEQIHLTEAQAKSAKDTGRFAVQFISPGWGSSGYYSKEVLEQAATDKVIPAGTHMYADHPTEVEAMTRPGRSLKDLMAVTVEDAKLSTTGALIGEVDVVPAWRPLLETVRDHIGVSIRGSASDIKPGVAEGRKGGIVESLVAPVFSVDFVTRAGRGGKILQVLESAQREDAALLVTEATAQDRMNHLRSAVRAAHGKDGQSVYVRDTDAEKSTVWFDIHQYSGGDTAKTYEQSYAVGKNDVDVSLTGDPVEVKAVTNYVPTTRSDSKKPTKESQEVPMQQIEEARLRELEEAHGRVPTLEAELATANARGDKAEGELAESRRVEAATKVIDARALAAKVAFTPLERKGLLAEIPLKESVLDVETFTKSVDEAAAAKLAAGGAGTVSGFGGTGVQDTGLTEADIDKAVGSAFGRTVKEA